MLQTIAANETHSCSFVVFVVKERFQNLYFSMNSILTPQLFRLIRFH